MTVSVAGLTIVACRRNFNFGIVKNRCIRKAENAGQHFVAGADVLTFDLESIIKRFAASSSLSERIVLSLTVCA